MKSGGWNIYLGGSPSSTNVECETVVGIKPDGVRGLGSNTAFIRSLNGLFGGSFTPEVDGSNISPLTNENGSYVSLMNAVSLMWFRYPNIFEWEKYASTNIFTWNFPTQFKNFVILCSLSMSGENAHSITHSYYNLSNSSVTYSLFNNYNGQQTGSPTFWAIGF